MRFSAQALGHDTDLATLRRGVRLAREILNQAGLRELVAEEIWPGPGISVAEGSNNLDDAIKLEKPAEATKKLPLVPVRHHQPLELKPLAPLPKLMLWVDGKLSPALALEVKRYTLLIAP